MGKQARGRKGPKITFSNDRTVKVRFRIVLNDTTTWSSSAAWGTFKELILYPQNLGSRLSAIALCFEYYRFLKVKAVLNVCKSGNGTETLSALAFDPTPSSLSGAISDLAAASELPCFSMGQVLCRPPTLTLGARELRTQPALWFNTTSTGSPDDQYRYQGTFYYQSLDFAVSSNQTHYLLLEGECEFMGMVDPSDSIAKRVEESKERDDAPLPGPEELWVRLPADMELRKKA
jgi:hypothetical protein